MSEIIYSLKNGEQKELQFSLLNTSEVKSINDIKARIKLQDGRVAMSYSMTNTFQTCPMKFLEEYINGIKLKTTKTSLAFGAAIHRGLEDWYRGLGVERAIAQFEQNYEDRESEELKTKANGRKIIEQYAVRYPSEAWEVLDIEVPITFEFTAGIHYVVIPDMVVKQGGRIYGVEHKHTKSISKNYFRQFKPNQQIDGEVAGIVAKFGSCDGIIINPIEIQKGGTRGRPSPAISFGPRDVSTRTEEDLEWWRRDMIRVHKEIDDTIKGGYFRANKGACHGFEGCQYRELHTQLGDSYIQSEYYEASDRNNTAPIQGGAGDE